MPPRLRPRAPPGSSQLLLATRTRLSRPSACLFCSLQRAAFHPKTSTSVLGRRRASAAAQQTPPSPLYVPSEPETPAKSTPSPTQNRADLADTLRALQQHAGVLVNISRIQLAIRSLQQPAGQESIRVAVLGLAAGTGSSGGAGAGKSAKQLLRLILADPLQDEPAWESQLTSHDPKEPLIVRVVKSGQGGQAVHGGPRISTTGGLAEIEVSSPVLNDSQLEFVVMESTLAVPKPPTLEASDALEGATTETFEETVLVPTVEIPVSQDGLRFTPVTAPVHQALIVADGIMGAAALANLPIGLYPGEIKGAVNLALPEKSTTPDTDTLPFSTFDPAASSEAIALFRASVANARAYETLWLRGGVSALARWLREGAQHRVDGTTKPPVRRLVASVLQSTLANIQAAEGRLLTAAAAATATSGVPASTFASLNRALATWAEAAHAELQAQLDLAFSGRPWRKLGWWKLFWRADDVTMLSSGLVTQRFLPQAEQDVVYLAGRIAEAVRSARPEGVVYAAPVVAGAEKATESTSRSASQPTTWPTHIAFTRRYLLDETVPALQALAQKLVLQTLGTSGLTTSLAVLTYLSSWGSAVGAGGVAGAGGLYEAGAVAALGFVWSLGRLQKKWEAARQFWEGEVREEGRKAVRAVEASVASALDEARNAAVSGGDEGGDRQRLLHDLREARALVEQAQEQLSRLK